MSSVSELIDYRSDPFAPLPRLCPSPGGVTEGSGGSVFSVDLLNSRVSVSKV